MKVNRVRIKQVRPHRHRHVGQRQVEIFALLQFDGGRCEIGVQGIERHIIGSLGRHIGKTKAAGTTDYILLANAQGGVEAGMFVTIQVGTFTLTQVPVR